MTGLVAVDKPEGLTSRQVSAKIGRILNEKRSGHTGTLDPMASGVLPVMLGRACKLIPFLPDKKAYRAKMRFGIKTDTGDITGSVTDSNDILPAKEDFEKIIPGFTGIITQVPSMYSALKKDGVPLYKLARSGKTVDVPERKVRIDSIKLLSFQKDECEIEVYCGGGTYIRTLCEDMAAAWGALAVMTSLRRIMDCGIGIDQCTSLNDIENGGITPVSEEALFSHLDEIKVPDDGRVYYMNGGSISIDRIDGKCGDGIYRVYSQDGNFLGLGRISGKNLKEVWLKLE